MRKYSPIPAGCKLKGDGKFPPVGMLSSSRQFILTFMPGITFILLTEYNMRILYKVMQGK